MKTVILLLGCLALTVSLYSQIPSNCNVSPVLREHYDKDIKHLALERIFTQNSIYKDSVEVSQVHQDTIWQSLAAIFNLTNQPQRDSIFEKYCIHQDVSQYYFEDLTVKISPNCPWYYNWKDLNIITGNAFLDSLFSRYGFTMTYYSNGTNWAFFTTPQSINMKALSNLVASVDYVLNAQPGGYLGDGDEIRYSRIGQDAFWEFDLGFGDCPVGCTGDHIYKYQVHPGCGVSFLGTIDHTITGLPLPYPDNCNISGLGVGDLAEMGFQVYPNPTYGNVTIEQAVFSSGQYSLQDTFGQILKTGSLSQSTRIVMEDLPAGIYFFSMFNETQKFPQVKIIKY